MFQTLAQHGINDSLTARLYLNFINNFVGDKLLVEKVILVQQFGVVL